MHCTRRTSRVNLPKTRISTRPGDISVVRPIERVVGFRPELDFRLPFDREELRHNHVHSFVIRPDGISVGCNVSILIGPGLTEGGGVKPFLSGMWCVCIGVMEQQGEYLIATPLTETLPDVLRLPTLVGHNARPLPASAHKSRRTLQIVTRQGKEISHSVMRRQNATFHQPERDR